MVLRNHFQKILIICYLNLPSTNKANVNIYDCFDLFTTDEILDGDNKYQHPKTKET